MPSRVRTLAVIDESLDVPSAEMVVDEYDQDVATPRVIDEVTVELARRHKREASGSLHSPCIAPIEHLSTCEYDAHGLTIRPTLDNSLLQAPRPIPLPSRSQRPFPLGARSRLEPKCNLHSRFRRTWPSLTLTLTIPFRRT